MADADGLFKKGLLNSSVDVTADEVAYFRKHPDEVDDFTAPVNIRKRFLWVGALLGAGLVAISKALKYGALENYLSVATSEFWVDIIFEVGVALIGAAVTAYLLEILLTHSAGERSKMAYRNSASKLGRKSEHLGNNCPSHSSPSRPNLRMTARPSACYSTATSTVGRR